VGYFQPFEPLELLRRSVKPDGHYSYVNGGGIVLARSNSGFSLALLGYCFDGKFSAPQSANWPLYPIR